MNFFEFAKMVDGKILRKDPVRNEVSSIETYWKKPGAALTHIQELLQKRGYLIEHASFNVHDRTPDYQQIFSIGKIIDPSDPNSETTSTDSDLIFNWHWMESGNQVEIVAYIS